MTTLYISTIVPTTKEAIAIMIAQHGVECQVYENCSSYQVDGDTVCESGYKIKLFDLIKEDFKEKVWDVLQEKLNLTCAHVKYRDEFRGCVRNWPKVFVKSRCGWEQDDEDEETDVKNGNRNPEGSLTSTLKHAEPLL